MLYWICFLLILAVLLMERLWLQHRRAQTPVRIHVHGTRGKSTVTRELAAALRMQGLRVLAKTTGDRPEYILPNGAITPIHRIGPARIKEHIKILHKAASMQVDAVVAEGMALQPETVYLSEKILQATHAVIVNTRPDHAETMGNGREGVLQTLRHMVPGSGELFTAEEAGADRLKEQCNLKSVPCSVVKAPATEQSLVLAQCMADALLTGREQSHNHRLSNGSAPPFLVNTEILGMPVEIYDLLSVNDVASSQLTLESFSLSADYLTVALLTARADRPLRTRDFMSWIVSESGFDVAAVMGGHAGYALLRGLFELKNQRFLWVRPWLAPERLLMAMRKKALEMNKNGLTVVALGNVHGYGEQWRAAMRQYETCPQQQIRVFNERQGIRYAD